MKNLRGIGNLAARSERYALLLSQTGDCKSYHVGLIDVQLVRKALELATLCCIDSKRHSFSFGHAISLVERLSSQCHATVEPSAGSVALRGVAVDPSKVADWSAAL